MLNIPDLQHEIILDSHTPTTEEKTVFIKLCRLSEEKIDLKSHNLFLQNCLNNSVIPKGLLPSFSSAVDKLHENLNYKLEFLDQNNSFNKMIVIISHYQNLLVNMDEEIEKVKSQLSDISSTNRYRYLLDTLEGFNKKHARKVNFIKAKKLKKLTKQRHTPDKNHPKSTDSNLWIPGLSLTNTEKNFILNGEYICDRIIDSSMMLIHQQKPCFIFQSTSFNHNLLQYCPYQVIHIRHDGNSHFITTTNSPDGSIKLYDSLNLPPSSDLLKQIRSIYSPEPNITPTILQAEIKHQQQGNTDCGLFAIAYAIDLAFGHDPANFIFLSVRNERSPS